MNGFMFFKSKSNGRILFQNPIQIRVPHIVQIQNLITVIRIRLL